jgi:hypothetical protein
MLLLAAVVSIGGISLQPSPALADLSTYTCTKFGIGLTFTLRQSNGWTVYITDQYANDSGDGWRAAYALNAKGKRVIDGTVIFGSAVENDIGFRFVWTDQKLGASERDYSFRMARVGTDRADWYPQTLPYHYRMADMHSTDPKKRDPDLDWTPVGNSRFWCQTATITEDGKDYNDYDVGKDFITD